MRTFHKVGQLVELFARIGSTPFGADTAYILGTVEHPEVVALGQILQFDKAHAETHIGFVATVVFHGIGPRHAQERLVELDTADFLEQMLDHALEDIENILLLHKRHFAVDLRKLGLTVGPQVFVAETLYNLEIAVEARHHQQLLEGLRRLRQRIELARIHSRRYHKVAGSLGSRLNQYRRLHLEEVQLVEITTYLEGHLVTQLEIAAYNGTAQVEVTVLHANIVAAIRLVFDGKGRSFCGMEHHQFFGYDFNVARRQIGVLVRALGHGTRHLYHIFAPQFIGLVAQTGVGLLVKYQLSDTVAIAQIDKSHTTHLTAALHPTGQGYLLAHMAQSQLSTCIRSIHCYRIYMFCCY